MKKVIFFLPVITFFTVITVGLQTVFGQQAKIKIDRDRTIGEISPLLYGNFVEHLGRCVYGGLWDPKSPQADEQGYRQDVIQGTKDLGITLLRYPGGNFVSNYHWLDGVGPQRIPRMELAWNRLETNEFGTNEFVGFTSKVGAEPYFAVNMGTGTIEEARRWVEYTNVQDGPYYAELRKKHGFPNAHKIKYWSLGNEMDGGWQMGHLNAEDYGKKAREAAKLMKMTDPEIKIIGAGSSNYGSNANPNHWNQSVLWDLRNYIDYIALHIYLGNPDNDFAGYMSTPMVMEERTSITRGLIERTLQESGRTRPIYIAWDEWNVWYRATGGAATSGERALEEHYNLEDALVVAGLMNVFIRNADIVKMANMAQLVNVIGPLFTDESRMYRQTIFYPFQLFAQHMKGTALDVYVDVEKYDTGHFRKNAWDSPHSQKDVPYLDVSASYDQGKLAIVVINRHPEQAIETEIISQEGNFSTDMQVFEINGPDVKSSNDFNGEMVKTVEKDKIKAKDNRLVYRFPAHSVTMLLGRLD